MGGGEVDDLLVYGEPAICPFRSADTRLFGICGDEGVERLSFAEPGSPCLEIVGRSATRIGFADPAIIAVIAHSAEIGRASCRERVCQYVENSVVAVSLKHKNTKT